MLKGRRNTTPWRRLLIATGLSVACHAALAVTLPVGDQPPRATHDEGPIAIAVLERGAAAVEAEAAAAEEESQPAAVTAGARPLVPSHEAAALSGERKGKEHAADATRSGELSGVSSRPAERAEARALDAPLAPRDGDAAEPAPQAASPAGVDLRARCSSCPVPEYPARARRQGWQGTVDVDLQVGRDGVVEQASVGRSSGYALLDHAAVSVARRSRFWLAGGAGGLRGQLRYRFVIEETRSRRPL